MNSILNFLYENLYFVAGLLLFAIGLIALIHFWKVKKALEGCETALAGIHCGEYNDSQCSRSGSFLDHDRFSREV